MNQEDSGITKLGCVNHDCEQCKTQRTWVGLTDEEIAEAVGAEIDGVYLRDFRAVEAKL